MFKAVEKIISDYKDLNELSLKIDNECITSLNDKNKNAEVLTPHELRQDMLDLIPQEFWTKLHPVFELCCGKGGFLIDIIRRFMDGLKDKYPDESKRYKRIVEKCLYFSDINEDNIKICKMLINRSSKYKLNYHIGDTLKLNIKDKWNLDGFDAIIGNPPFHAINAKNTGNPIWQHFIKYSLNNLKQDGFLVFVNPAGWRKPNTKGCKYYGLFKLMTHDNQMLQLSIHNIKDGYRVFKCWTRYDWYIIEKKQKYKSTRIIDEERKLNNINMDKFNWLPNSNIKLVKKLLATGNQEKHEIVCGNTNHRSNKPLISNIKTDEFKYPCVHSTPKSGIRYLYSKINTKGYFDVPKIIFGESRLNNAFIDMDCKYGMTQHAFGIKISNLEEAVNIKKALLSDKFKIILKACSWGIFRVEYRMFMDFKKDFWKEFI